MGTQKDAYICHEKEYVFFELCFLTALKLYFYRHKRKRFITINV